MPVTAEQQLLCKLYSFQFISFANLKDDLIKSSVSKWDKIIIYYYYLTHSSEGAQSIE